MNDSQLQQMLLQVAETPPQKVWEQVDAVLTEDTDDRHLQQKLVVAELEPPIAAWDKIEADLTEQDRDNKLADRLLSAEEPLPDEMWFRIEQQLNDEDWNKQLQETEETPPAGVWNSIEANLDYANQDEQFARLLLQSTEIPPAEIWQAVEQELNKEQPGKVIQMFPKWKPFLRFAAAAVVISAITWGVYQIITETKGAATVAEIKPSESLSPADKNIQPATEKIQENNSTALNELPVKQKTKVKSQLSSAQIAANGLTDHLTSKSVPV